MDDGNDVSHETIERLFNEQIMKLTKVKNGTGNIREN